MKNFIFLLFVFCFSALAAGTYIKIPASSGGGGGGSWGSITGTLSDQGDLQSVLNGKWSKNTDIILQTNKCYLFAETGNDTGSCQSGDGIFDIKTNGSLTARLSDGNINVTHVMQSESVKTDDIKDSNDNDSVQTYVRKLIDNTGGTKIDWQNALLAGNWSVENNFAVNNGILNFTKNAAPNDNGGQTWKFENLYLDPLQTSVDEGWVHTNSILQFDPNNTGYAIGTNSNHTLHNLGFFHNGKSDIGNLNVLYTNSSIGNGTDPISVGGYGLLFGQGNFASGVTMNGPLQGHGFQYNFQSGSTMNSYINGFYDFNNIAAAVNGYQAFDTSADVQEIRNNSNFTSFTSNSRVRKLTGNAGHVALAINDRVGEDGIDSGAVQGILISQTVTGGSIYNALYSSTQNSTSATKWAGYFDGPVHANSLELNGPISPTYVNSFTSFDVSDGGGQPFFRNLMGSQIVVPVSTTTANADSSVISHPAILQLNGVYTSGGFGLGQSSQLTPLVIIGAAGGSGDYAGAGADVVADGGSSGGHIDQIYGRMIFGTPLGALGADRYHGLWSKIAGSVATKDWSGYFEGAQVYMESGLKIGGTKYTNDEVGAYKLNVEGDSKLGGAVQIGSNGTSMQSMISNTGVLDYGSINPNSYEDQTLSAFGASVGDTVMLGPPSDQEPGLVTQAFVSSADTVTIRAQNVGSGSIDQSSKTYRITVIHY